MFHKCICWLQCSKIDPDLEMFLRCSHSFLGTLAPSVSKYHPYVWSLYFKDQLRGLPSSEAFRSNYLRAVHTRRIKCWPSGREADNERSYVESVHSSVRPEGSDDLVSLGVNAVGDGLGSDPTTLAVLAG